MGLLFAALLLCSVLEVTIAASLKVPPVPEYIVGAYASWGQCDEKMLKAVDDGANVLFWFSVNLECDPAGNPVFGGALPSVECIRNIQKQLVDKSFENIVHLVSIGGWNAAHPCKSHEASEWFTAFHKWNCDIGFLFHGIDWDLEGNDNLDNSNNQFSRHTLLLMADLSKLMKSNGYIVAMAPAESYLDPNTGIFSSDVTWPPLNPWHQDFTYTGRNVYAFAIARAGIETFDFISIQLYEGYSGANYAMNEMGTSAKEYVDQLMLKFSTGWYVDFSHFDADLGSRKISISNKKLVIGLGNAWTSRPGKFLFIDPQSELSNLLVLPRGFMFWDIADEYRVIGSRSYCFACLLSKIPSRKDCNKIVVSDS